MARYTGPSCRLCRREGKKLFLKGERCYSDKCAVTRREAVPGQHGKARMRKQSEYGLQLRAKQSTRRYYGVLEGQFRGYFEEASRKPGMAGENLMRILESRLDNIAYRCGFASSRKEARQLVRHNHFRLNGHKANIPSIQGERSSALIAVDIHCCVRQTHARQYGLQIGGSILCRVLSSRHRSRYFHRHRILFRYLCSRLLPQHNRRRRNRRSRLYLIRHLNISPHLGRPPSKKAQSFLLRHLKNLTFRINRLHTQSLTGIGKGNLNVFACGDSVFYHK